MNQIQTTPDLDGDDDDVNGSSPPKDEPLSDFKNPPTLMELQQDLQDAKPIHDAQISKINAWLDNLNVTGKARIAPKPNSSSIVPKLIRKQAEWRYAALSEPFLSTDDLFNVNPVTFEDKKAAQQNQLVLNKQINIDINKTKFIDEYVRAAVDEGTVILKTGWHFEEEEVEQDFPVAEYVVNPDFQPTIDHVEDMKQHSPSEYQTDVPEELKRAHQMSMEKGVAIEPKIVGHERRKVMKTTCNKPTVEVCNFRNVTIDPTCMGDIDKAGFVIYSFESSMSELKKDGKYKNLDKILITGNSLLAEPDHSASIGARNFQFNDEARKKIVVYEYWGSRDLDGTGIVKPFVAAWIGNTLIRLEANPFPDKKPPFIVEQYLPVRREIYGEPDGALLEDNQKVLGAVTRGIIDLMGKSANGQTGIRKDMLDATNRRKYDQGRDYEFNQNVDPKQGVHMHTYPEIPQSAQFMIQLMNMEAESMTGVKSWNNGVSGKALGDVAAGVRGALDAASKRELGILRRLSSGIVKLGRKLISMNSEFLSDEEIIRITNEQFVTVKKDDLAGNFDLKLSISTAEEDNNKAEQLAFMLQTVGPNADPALLKKILAEIFRLRKMPDLAKDVETFQPQPDPIQQKMQQLELARMDAEIAEIQAKTQKLLAEAGLSGVKAGTEQAKAKHLSTAADLNNLNFVEQESGVKQERDKELSQAQAQGNMQLEAVKHQFQSQRDEKAHKVDLVKTYIQAKSKEKAKTAKA